MQYYEILDNIQRIMDDSIGDEAAHEINCIVKYLEQNRPSMLSTLILNGGFDDMTHLQCFLLGMQSVLDHIHACGTPEDLERMVSQFAKEEHDK